MTAPLLIVDDDPFIRRLIATTLEDLNGYVLREAGDGEAALAAARAEPPAVVFLDVTMPRLDGIETCKRLRADAATADAKIVMLTAASGPEAEGTARAAGCDLYLTKPFSPLELLRLVEQI